MSGPLISVIVPAYNAAATIRLCMKSIREATEARIELIVVDDGSTDETFAAIEGVADHAIRSDTRRGAAAARNRGRSYASGELLLFVDADVACRPGSIDRLLAGLGADAAAFGSYGPLPPIDVRNQATRYKNHLHYVTHQHAGSHVATFWSGFGLVRAQHFDDVGQFPLEALDFADVEDIRLGYALTAAGHRVAVVPGAQVDHYKQFTLRRLIVTDLLHRAVPWADAMLATRTFRRELAVSNEAIVSSLAAWTGVAAAVLDAPAVSAGAGAAWLAANRRFLGSAFRTYGSSTDAAATVALHGLFSLYAPVGAVAGVGAFALRRFGPRRVRLRRAA